MKASRRWTSEYPELGTRPVPIEPFISSQYFEGEREHVFRRVWLSMGREERIPQVGDYFVKELPVCGTSVIIVRGKDRKIRAFHNMCTHRGNRVAEVCRGSAGSFRCGFHGWTYDLMGQLIYVPDEDQFFDLDKSEHGLTRVSADVWEGFIFVNLDPNPKETLVEYLGQVVERLQGYPFGDTTEYSYQAEVRANWKVAVDAFQEGYHAPVVHKHSVGDAYVTKENPFIHCLDVTLYRLHRIMSVPGSLDYTPTPVQKIAHQLGASVLKRDVSVDELPSGINRLRSPNWGFDQIIIFPNFSLFVFDGTYISYSFWPLTLDRTLWETCIYYPRAECAGQRFSQEYAKCALRDTLLEDGNIIEAVQSNLTSGARTHFVLQDQEILVRHFHKVLSDFVGVG